MNNRMGDYGENSGSVGGIDPPTPTVTAASGSLRGGEDLWGGRATLPDTSAESESAVVPDAQYVNGQSADHKLGLYLDFNSVDAPQPERGGYGGTDPGPRTYYYERINSDVYAPPGTDNGAVDQAMWPLGLSHNRHGSDKGAGWARQQNKNVLPSADAMAGVDMRLGPNAYRELHWHTANEWSLITKGCVRVATVGVEGETFVDDVCAGDVWFFPSGIPHSIQAFDEGVEFLLVFDDGDFSEDGTFLVSEMMLRNPVSVLAKNFKAEPSAFDDIPQDELYVSLMNPSFVCTSRPLTRIACLPDLQRHTSAQENRRHPEPHLIGWFPLWQRPSADVPLVATRGLRNAGWVGQDCRLDELPGGVQLCGGAGDDPAGGDARDPLAHDVARVELLPPGLGAHHRLLGARGVADV